MSNMRSASFQGWPFPMLKYKSIFQIKYTVATLSNSTWKMGGTVAEWLACCTQAQNGLGSNRSRNAVG